MIGVALHQLLPASLRERLLVARSRIAAAAKLDESRLLPAHQRYAGHFYVAAADALERAVQTGLHVLIISGGYGVVHAAEPIGWYDFVFSKKDWPEGLLNDVITSYARANELRQARALLASSTSYRKLLDDVDWSVAGISDAVLLTPTVSGGGAMLKAPRALGEAFSACIHSSMSPNWCSSDGTALMSIRMSRESRC